MILRKLRFALVLMAALLSFACATPEPYDPLLGPKLSGDKSAPLGGNALAEHRGEMRRASRDLANFHGTLVGLRQRRDAVGHRHFKHFVDAYMAEHLDPMIAREWQSEHPALAGIDANLRVMKAALLIQMGEPYRVQPVIDELARRFLGRSRILVTYPSGVQVSIKKAIEILQDRKWRVGRLET